jgi:putative membrane protein
MRFTIVLGLAVGIMAQEHRYSSKPPVPAGKSKGGMHVKNAIDFTPEGDFLRKAALDNAFATEFGVWASAHGENPFVRSTASELGLLEMKFGDDLHKLAGRKHVILPEKVNDRDAAERARIDRIHTGDSDRSFIEQLLRLYDQEMVRFQAEAQSGSDPEIRGFAADGVGRLQKHRRLVEGLEDKVK